MGAGTPDALHFSVNGFPIGKSIMSGKLSRNLGGTISYKNLKVFVSEKSNLHQNSLICD